MSTVLITGCGSGFGQALARRMLQEGHHVVATDPVRSALEPLASDRTLCLALDVRDAQQVDAAVAAALAWRPVDVLVNNGGFALFGTQEELDIELVRDMFDVNVFGAGRMTAALLPTLRERSGTVVQISSVAGRTVFPESGWYAASKHAIEAMSDALIQECGTFGVRVRVIEPGSFATRFLETAAARSPEPGPTSPYAHLRDPWMARKVAVLEPPQSPTLVVDAIVASLARRTAFERVVVGPDAQRILDLRDGLGADPFSRLSARRNGLLEGTVGPQDVLLPQDVPSAPNTALTATLLAYRTGHLDHWQESDVGRAALVRLAEEDKGASGK